MFPAKPTLPPQTHITPILLSPAILVLNFLSVSSTPMHSISLWFSRFFFSPLLFLFDLKQFLFCSTHHQSSSTKWSIHKEKRKKQSKTRGGNKREMRCHTAPHSSHPLIEIPLCFFFFFFSPSSLSIINLNENFSNWLRIAVGDTEGGPSR